MSFPGQNVPNSGPKPGFKEILGKLSEAAQKKSAELEGESQDESPPDDLNFLPLPDNQEIHDDCIIWTWECNGNDNFSVQATLHTSGNKKGEYYVEMFHTSGPNVVGFIFTEAKEIGQALISAWRYQYVWKDYAGEFMEKGWQ